MTDASPVPPRSKPPGRNPFCCRLLVATCLLALFCAASGFASAPHARATGQATALVLEPFPSQHSPGFSAQNAVAILQSAGFQVTELEGPQVTVPVMKTLSHYAVVYIFTHAGPLPNEDAAVSTGDSRHQRYKRYFTNQTLAQMRIHSDYGYLYFDAITGRFLHLYGGKFSPHSVVFINACTALGMPLFWKYLKQAGVGTLISWEHHVSAYDADVAADDVLGDLAAGKTVAQAIKDTKALGGGRSVGGKKIGLLNFVGDGQNTFANATSGALDEAP